MELLIPLAATLLIILLFGAGLVWMFNSFLQRPGSHQAMIVHKSRGPTVLLQGAALVIPVVMRVEWMDLKVKQLKLERRGAEGIHCKDGVRVDVEALFFVRVNRSSEDILKVAQSVGCERATDLETLHQLFEARFWEAIKAVIAKVEVEEALRAPSQLRDAVLDHIGVDLNGYTLDDLALDRVSQTPADQLDPNNILDAKGLRKIAEMNRAQELARLEVEKQTEIQKARQQREIRELMQEYEAHKLAMEEGRAQQEAEDRRQAALAQVKARQQAEEARIQAATQAAIAEHQRELESYQRAIEWERQKAVEELEVRRRLLLARAEQERRLDLERRALLRKAHLRLQLLGVLRARKAQLGEGAPPETSAAQGTKPAATQGSPEVAAAPGEGFAGLPGLTPWKLE